MTPLPILTLVTLPNGESTEIYFADMESENWISPQIVEALSKTGQIIHDGDQVFVEFERESDSSKYCDGAWCKIGSMADTFIILGKTWLEERCAIIDPERKACTVRPPHLSGVFTIYNTSVQPQKKEDAMLIEVVYEPGLAWIEAYEDDSLCGDDWDEVLPIAPEQPVSPEQLVTPELPVSLKLLDGVYGGQAQHWQQNVVPQADHVVKIPPHVSPPPAYASRPPIPPTPPAPPVISNSGGSGSNYSGSENPLPPPSPGIALGFSKSTFTYEELLMATDGFSDANLLGQGGFGYVHRGMLPNGKEVAVKQLKLGSGQGEREFQAEVEIISRVHHKHLVSLVGYCINGGKRLLVYEFVPNNTLEFHLHGKGRPVMEWSTRLKIALGSAKGIAYLHEDCHPKIIHRDIKAANILLDYKFETKVADFGLAKFASDTNTHVSTRVMGTFGYLAPEYASSGKLSDKSDVFSFGVMLLELITGRRPVDSANTFMDDSLVDWARPLLSRAQEDRKYDAIVDPRLQDNYNTNEMAHMVACAAACVRHSARRRPRMSQIVRVLEGDISLEDLNDGVRPGHSTVYSYGSSDYDSGQYNEDMKNFRKLALSTQEYTNTEYSEPTSEYGQNPSGSSSEGRQTREMEMPRMKNDSRGFSGSS